jgi:hypothetical protein
MARTKLAGPIPYLPLLGTNSIFLGAWFHSQCHSKQAVCPAITRRRFDMPGACLHSRSYALYGRLNQTLTFFHAAQGDGGADCGPPEGAVPPGQAASKPVQLLRGVRGQPERRQGDPHTGAYLHSTMSGFIALFVVSSRLRLLMMSLLLAFAPILL